MVPTVINIPVPNNPYPNRQFCVKFEDAVLQHVNETTAKQNGLQYVFIFHDNKEVLAGVNKDLQKAGNQSILYKPESIVMPRTDVIVEDDIFLLYDDAGVNYIHFFFDMFGRCFYFEQLRKQYPNLKLGIPEEFYQENGKSNFIKQWLELYLEDKNIDVFVFEKDKNYQIKNLFVSNLYYWFPEHQGYGPIFDMIRSVTDKVEPIKTNSTGAYISRQDTIKRGWYHGRDLINELELIDQIKNKLGYDIVEMMDYTIKEKIQLSKSYKTIIQQSSASNINILFASANSNSVVISNPKMGPWLNAKCYDFSTASKSNLLVLEDVGECIVDSTIKIDDANNYPWQLTNIDGILEILLAIEDGSVWTS
jgi:hypothetical protein